VPGLAAERLKCADLGTLMLALGLAALIVPAIADLWRASWSPDSGSQVPFVLGGIALLVWRERAVLAVPPAPMTSAATIAAAVSLLALVPAFVAARMVGAVQVELLILIGIVLIIVRMELGWQVLRRLWFAPAFALFLATPSNTVIVALTRPLKLWLTDVATAIAAAAGLDVGASGTIIQVDGFQLLVAAACSGINSLIGAVAICLFYVYWRRGSEPVFALILSLLMVPVVVLANLLRILVLIFAVHLFGDEVVESVFHPVAGFAIFAVSVLLLFLFDALLYPRYRRYAQ
jgi:exosortase